MFAYDFCPVVELPVRLPQTVKPVFIKDRMLSSKELIDVSHAGLPHVVSESGPDVGHSCMISVTYRVIAPSHVSSPGGVTFTILSG